MEYVNKGPIRREAGDNISHIYEIDFSAFTPQEADAIIRILKLYPKTKKPSFLNPHPPANHYEIAIPFITSKLAKYLRYKHEVASITLTPQFPSLESWWDGLTDNLISNINDEAHVRNINWESLLGEETRRITISKTGERWLMTIDGTVKITFQEPSLLSEALRNPVQRINVNLSKMNLTKKHIEELGTWAKGLSINELDLSNNNLVPSDIEALMQVLPDLNIKSINLKGNDLEARKNRLIRMLKDKGVDFSL